MDLRERRVKLEKLAKLTGAHIEVMYYRCLDKNVSEITDILKKENEGTIWSRFTRIFRLLEIAGEDELVTEYCPLFQEFIKSEDDWKNWGNIRSEILRQAWTLPSQSENELSSEATLLPEEEKASLESEETQDESETGSATSGSQTSELQDNIKTGHEHLEPPRRPIWPLIAIPALVLCLLCIGAFSFGARFLPTLFGEDVTPNETSVIQAPSNTAASLPTETLPVLPTETSLPTFTHTPLPPTTTSSPTDTPQPTLSPTSSAPSLFRDDFNNGKSPSWQVMFGSEPAIVNGALNFNDLTLMVVESNEWTDYEVHFWVSNMQCQQHVGSRGLTIGLRVQDANNMVGLRLNDQDDCAATWMVMQNGEWKEVPNSTFRLPPVDASNGRNLVVRVRGNEFSSPIGTSVIIENFATGAIAFLGSPAVIIDNVAVIPLIP